MLTDAGTPPKNEVLPTEKPIIISISGDLGSGKSVLATGLVETFAADRYSTGMVQRKIADQMGITTLELNKRAETDKSIDDRIDSVFRNLEKTPKNLIVDSRMAFHFLPMSFRIKLEVDPQIAVMRIKGDTSRVGEGPYNSIEEVQDAIAARKASERARFKTYYNVDIADHAGYDLVINTTDCPVGDVVELAKAAVHLWVAGKTPEKLWISPKHLFVHVDADTLDTQNTATWPAVGSWPEGAIEVSLAASAAGPAYVVTKGAAWVSAAIKGGKALVPVTLVEKQVVLPSLTHSEKWEKHHNFNRLFKAY